MQKKMIACPAGNIVYWISDPFEPAKDTLFFMHGMTADHTMFYRQFPAFRDICSIIAWDAPAHGESRPFADFSFDRAADCMAAILDENHVDQAVLIGQSLGGYFAQAFIRKYPDRAKGFISIDSTPFGTGYYSGFDTWILKQVEWMAKLYPLSWMKKAMAKQVSVTKESYDNMTEMLQPYGKNELCHLMGLGYSAFLEENSDMTIPCPVVLIVGEHDKTGKVKAYNNAWAKRTGYPLFRISHAAHNSNVDNPAAVNGIISDFLRNLKQAG